MFGLMVDIGLKFLSVLTLSRGITLGSRLRTYNFHKYVIIFVFMFI